MDFDAAKCIETANLMGLEATDLQAYVNMQQQKYAMEREERQKEREEREKERKFEREQAEEREKQRQHEVHIEMQKLGVLEVESNHW